MAFAATGLQKFNNGGALGAGGTLTSVASLWHYVTDDADTVVEADGYFDTTAMAKGDILLASLDVDGTPEVKFYVVGVGTGDPASNDVSITAMLVA